MDAETILNKIALSQRELPSLAPQSGRRMGERREQAIECAAHVDDVSRIVPENTRPKAQAVAQRMRTMLAQSAQLILWLPARVGCVARIISTAINTIVSYMSWEGCAM